MHAHTHTHTHTLLLLFYEKKNHNVFIKKKFSQGRGDFEAVMIVRKEEKSLQEGKGRNRQGEDIGALGRW